MDKRSGIGSFGRRVLVARSETICVSDLPFILLRLASYLVYFGTKSLSETFIWTKKIRAGFLTFSRHFGSGSGWRARPQKWKSAKIHRMPQIPPGKLPIPSESYCSRPLVDSWNADDIPTAPEGPGLGKPCVWGHSPAKFDNILPNFAAILTILVREALVSLVCIGNG